MNFPGSTEVFRHLNKKYGHELLTLSLHESFLTEDKRLIILLCYGMNLVCAQLPRTGEYLNNDDGSFLVLLLKSFHQDKASSPLAFPID